LKFISATREKQAAECSLSTLQTQYDNLSSQQNHLADLRHVSEQMKVLTTLVSQVNEDELSELKRIRDRFHALEGEHASLQKRFREQENQFANSQRATLVVKQNLTQAQLRASEHERRAKEYESQLEMVQTKLDQAEHIQTQLDADYSLATLQLEEREADHRYTKVRSNCFHPPDGILTVFRNERPNSETKSNHWKPRLPVYRRNTPRKLSSLRIGLRTDQA
jgi:chromosome segregation ATPase